MSDQDNKKISGPGKVQDFYERYPYPRPVGSLDKYRELWQDPERRRADFHLFWPSRSFSEDHSILVAGCGTSQAAKHAMRWPRARVTGIDFSSTSIECTRALKEKYSLDNLTLHQLPVERAGELAMEFDQIVCTGVLHHLPDPDAGLAALTNVLRPGGAMHLMVYAPYGRTGIYMLQEFCRWLGITATDDGIRDLITALKSLPPGHPLETLLREAPDFRHEAALADALLHPQDRSYSVLQLFEFLANGGLEFGRWLRQAAYSSQCGIMARLPQAERLSQLTPRERYAAVELFRGTMVTHSVVAYRDDTAKTQTISFSGEEWPRYVPVRLPDTICVEERLPDGAAGVLINRTHTYTDIYLPITAAEKCLFDAIDGRRTIGEIAERAMPSVNKSSQPEITLRFFEQLWWHDQIVFDASPQS